MAPPRSSTTKSIQSQRKNNRFKSFYKKYVNFEYIMFLLTDPEAIPIVSILILLSELVINIFIVQRVKYTEIDWIAYMQECEGFLNGTTNYELLRGDTGPLVYPAAFVYIYSALYFLTSQGRNVKLAQYIFIGLYLLQMWLVLRLYSKSRKVPPFVLILSAFTSYRIHSIFVLRLFNDPVAIVFLYASLNLFLDRRWTFGSVLFSIAVGIKMNILLFAPALLLFYITNLGYIKTAIQLLVCGVVQLLLGAPFLLTYPWQYVKGSFDLGRVFEHKWTVNYRFLPREYFENVYFHLFLLVLHISLLGIFSKPIWKFFKNYARLRELQNQMMPQIQKYNENLKAAKLKKKSSDFQFGAEAEEQLTAEQEKFLKSFEESLKKSAGAKTSLTTINRPKAKPFGNNLNDKKEASINFDQCTQLALLPFFFCNFVGIICARSLHYQFYVWYFHSLPYLLWCTNFSLGIRFLLLGLIELCWNTYPSTNFSSSSLHFCHFFILFGVGYYLFTAIKTPIIIEKNTKKD